MSPTITATKLYNAIICPHRVMLDEFEDPSLRDPESPFLKLLWEKGIQHEQAVVENLKFLNIINI